MLEFTPKSCMNHQIDPSNYIPLKELYLASSEPIISRRLVIFDLKKSVTEKHVFEAFFMFGEITKIEFGRICKNNSSKLIKFAVIEFPLLYSARKAFENRRKIKVDNEFYKIVYSNIYTQPSMTYDNGAYELTVDACTTVNILFKSNLPTRNTTKEFCTHFGKVKAINKFVTNYQNEKCMVHCVEFDDKNDQDGDSSFSSDGEINDSISYAQKSVKSIIKAFTKRPDEEHIRKFLEAHPCIIDYAINGRNTQTLRHKVEQKLYKYEYEVPSTERDVMRLFPTKSKLLANDCRAQLAKSLIK